MAPLPNVSDALKVAVEFTDSSGQTFGFRKFYSYTGSSPASADCVTAASSIFTHMSTEYAGLFPSNISLTSVTVEDLSSSSGGSGTHSGNTPGTRSGGGMAINVCTVVNDQITRRYRGGKPRSYPPFGTETDLNAPNLWSSTFTAAVETAWANVDAYISALTIGSALIVAAINVSYYSGFDVVVNPITGRSRNVPTRRVTPLKDTINSTVVSARPGSQRRRRG